MKLSTRQLQTVPRQAIGVGLHERNNLRFKHRPDLLFVALFISRAVSE